MFQLIEAIKITIKDVQTDNSVQNQADQLVVVNRQNDDLSTKIQEHDLTDLKIGVKIFLNSENQELALQALEQGKYLKQVSKITQFCVILAIVAYQPYSFHYSLKIFIIYSKEQ